MNAKDPLRIGSGSLYVSERKSADDLNLREELGQLQRGRAADRRFDEFQRASVKGVLADIL